MPDIWLALHLTPTLHLACVEPTRWPKLPLQVKRDWVRWVVWSLETCVWTPPLGQAPGGGPGNPPQARVHLVFFCTFHVVIGDISLLVT